MHAEEFGRIVGLVEIDSSYNEPRCRWIVDAIVELEGGMKTTVAVEKIRSPGETAVNGSSIGVYIDDEGDRLIG